MSEFLPLSAAETELLAHSRSGRRTRLSGELPKKPTENTLVRAAFLRFLAVGGDSEAPVHEKGPQLEGAFIEGALDLDSCVVSRPIVLSHCYFDAPIIIDDANINGLYLNDCHLPRLSGNRVNARGGIFLRRSIVKGEANLSGAIVGGSLDWAKSKFENKNEFAVILDDVEIKGNVNLSGCSVLGETRIVGAKIRGQLICDAGNFENPGGNAMNLDLSRLEGGLFLREGFLSLGEIRLLAARVGGPVDCTDGAVKNIEGDAISADGAIIEGDLFFNGKFVAEGKIRLTGTTVRGDVNFDGATLRVRAGKVVDGRDLIVQGGLLWRRLNAVEGVVAFDSAHVGTLADDWASWEKAEDLILADFRYDRVLSAGDLADAEGRIRWLKHQHPEKYGARFWPQPWEHLAKVLREIGHSEEAKLVAMEKQREMRRLGLIGSRKAKTGLEQPLRAFDVMRVATLNGVSRLMHRAYGALAGYGYRPLRTFMLMASFWLLAAGGFWIAENRGLFVPSAISLLTDSQFESCGPTGEGRIRWTRCPKLPRDYTTFDPLMYSLDVILPLVDLRQEADWEPLVRRGAGWQMWDGLIVRGIMWVEILFGWIGSLLIVSALGRLVQKD